ncbi:S-type pyocin family protein [Brevundimonas sp. SORGH_AS_0993]|uniref:S-type pyocin family protein n=1 Tax=Brevundimonas sp. SORGH_AS_0993 TaxID=3041794 RepID=UPI0027892830|nr:S-type pyocin family protein [Brevundimonas sp. SORGH_AS_0993]MDQ1154951.1 pyocin large subunit-like protein [Brevundimonas sp. SORGH_AS_0993]
MRQRAKGSGWAGTATALALLALAGCDRPSAVETRERAAGGDAPLALASTPETADAQAPQTAQPKSVLTANRRETTDAKVARLFDRNGAAFGARTPDDYLTKVAAFTSKPPRDVETVKRPNGDTLIYQASTNTFAVVARDGTARTMFKPTTGAAYWSEQKAAAPTFGRRRQSTDAAG